MKKIIIALRILATIFLVGVVVSVVKTPLEITKSVGFLSLSLNASFAIGSNEVFFSSTFFGFVLSLIATRLSMKYTGRCSEYQGSMIIAVLALLSLSNEITRLFHNHLQVLLVFPLLQVIMDWVSVRALKPPPPAQPTTPPKVSAEALIKD